MVARCKSNENGRFSIHLGLVRLSLRVKSKMLFFSERQSYFEEKKHRLFVFLLRASYMQKGSEIEFSSLAEEILFCLILVGICS